MLVRLQGPLLAAKNLQIGPPDCCPLLFFRLQMDAKEKLCKLLVVGLIAIQLTLKVRTAPHHGCPASVGFAV